MRLLGSRIGGGEALSITLIDVVRLLRDEMLQVRLARRATTGK